MRRPECLQTGCKYLGEVHENEAPGQGTSGRGHGSLNAGGREDTNSTYIQAFENGAFASSPLNASSSASAPLTPGGRSLGFYRHQVEAWSMTAAEQPQPEVRGREETPSISHLTVKDGRKRLLSFISLSPIWFKGDAILVPSHPSPGVTGGPG